MKKKELENFIAEAVRKGVKSALVESSKPAPKKKITRTQLAEGVRKALRLAMKESAMASVGMPGGAMPAPGMAAGGATSAPTQEGMGNRKPSMTFGTVPSPEELQDAIDREGGWDMDLQGSESIAFDYAMKVAGLGYPDMNTGRGMHQVLTALFNCPPPDQLPADFDDEEIQNPGSELNHLLDRWDQRYGDMPIEQTAESLASGILDVLGWESV